MLTCMFYSLFHSATDLHLLALLIATCSCAFVAEEGVGHTSARAATDQFLQDRDRLDEAVEKEGDGDNDSESERIQGSWGDDRGGRGDDDNISLRGGSGGDDGEGLGGDDEEPGTGDVDNEGRNGDEEEDYGYGYLVDEDEEEEDDEPLDVADDVLGPEDGEGDVDEVNLLGFTAF